jgi:hypothetical protein
MKSVILIVLVIVIGACSKPVEKQTIPLQKAEISGKVLWTRITAESDYNSYAYWPGHEEIQPGQSPHGVYHRIFINNFLSEALPVSNKISPEGTIIVKENINSDKKIDAITVMAKVKDYNPEVGDWFWAKYSPEGEVIAEGTPGGCISCHEGMVTNDFIIVRPLDLESGISPNS